MENLDDVKRKLQEKLDNLEYQSRIKSGEVLDQEDVDFIFNFLKKNDPELAVVLESVQKYVSENLKTDYIETESRIRDILKYYNLIPGGDFINSRHQYFFSDDKKLTKKLFFNQPKMEIIKEEFSKSGIFKKISL